MTEPIKEVKVESDPLIESKADGKEMNLRGVYDAVIELTKTVADLVKEQKTLGEQIEKSRKAGKF